MAIVSMRDKPLSREATFNSDWSHTYVRVIQVITDNVNVGPQAVINSLPFGLGNTYVNLNSTETDSRAFVQSISAKEAAQGGMIWDVTVEYGPRNPLVFGENPLTQPPEVEWGFAPYERIPLQDNDGNAVLNTAGCPFDPPPKIDDCRVVLTIVRNEETFNPSKAYSYRNAVNSDAFMGAAPRQVKMTRISGQRQWSEYLSSIGVHGGFYWQVTYEMCFNPDTWDLQSVNQGLMKLNLSTNKPEKIKDSNNSEISQPVALDENGQPLPVGSDPFIVVFRCYPEMPFAALDLPYPGP